MSESTKSRGRSIANSVARAFLLIAVCLFGFFYGIHLVTIATAPSLNNVSPQFHPVLSIFTEKSVPPMRPGHQKKAGMVPELFWKRESADVRKEIFESWLFRYIHHNFIVHPVVPYPTCQVYINHEYKFIWIKGHKVGSTALREPLGWLCDDHWKIPEHAKFDHCSHALWRQTVTTEEVQKYWKEYFVFGAMRNPYDRFASAFEYLKGSEISGPCAKSIGQLTFGTVCQDPYIHTVHCALSRCWCSTHHFRHFMPQAPCLMTESLLPAVDYLADMSTLNEDLETILHHINERRDESLPPLELNQEQFTHVNVHRNETTTRQLFEKRQADRKADQPPEYVQELYKIYPHCLESVAHFFHQDFILLGYDKNSRGNWTLSNP